MCSAARKVNATDPKPSFLQEESHFYKVFRLRCGIMPMGHWLPSNVVPNISSPWDVAGL